MPETAAPWRLKKETLPPGFLKEADWWNVNKERLFVRDRENSYFLFLFEAEHGAFGWREGNPWRLSRRKWIEHFVRIQDKRTLKIIPFKLNEAQRKLEAEIIRLERKGLPVRVAILKARQQGMSTYVAACFLWLSMTMPRTRVLLMGHKNNSAEIIRERMGTMVELVSRRDGRPWKFRIATNNRKELELDEPIHSTIIAETAVGADYRGDTVRAFHAIEPAEWPNAKDKANAVMQLVPQAENTWIVIEGTARGETGWFAETWKDAWRRQRESGGQWGGTVACFFPWYLHQNYRWSVINRRPLPLDLDAEIRATLSEDEAALLQTKYLLRGKGWVTVDTDQLAWRRYAIAELCQGSLEHFHQEYPATPEEAFLSTGMKFFSAKTIAEYRIKYAGPPIWRGDTTDSAGEGKMQMTLEDLKAVL